MLVDKFMVVENIIFGKELSKFGVIEKKKVIEEIKEIFDCYGLCVDLNVVVWDILIGM